MAPKSSSFPSGAVFYPSQKAEQRSRKRLEQLCAQRLIWAGHSTTLQRQEGVSSFALGLTEIDSHLPDGGLNRGAIHEWFLDFHPPSLKKHRWLPPLSIILGALAHHHTAAHPLRIAWIGKNCWPAPQALAEVHRDTGPWERYHLFLDPRAKSLRLWSIIEALRSSAISLVVADGSCFDMKASRRLQLAAQQQRAIGFIVRPSWELSLPSVAYTRWKVSPHHTNAEEPQWTVELVRSKGGALPRQWTVCWINHEKNPLRVFPELGLRNSELSEEHGRQRANNRT